MYLVTKVEQLSVVWVEGGGGRGGQRKLRSFRLSILGAAENYRSDLIYLKKIKFIPQI